jgi:Domain of unknown function (DUF4270)
VKRKIFVLVIVLLSALVVYNSCTKIDTTDIGGDLIPPIDNIHTFDTSLEVFSDNKLFVDTTRMSYSEPHGVGIIDDDPEFGKTTAALYSNFTPVSYRTYPFINRSEVKIDSVILSLAYTRTYGDSNSVQQFEVREIDPVAEFKDSSYPVSAPDFAVLPGLIGSKTVNFIELDDTAIYKNAKDTVRTSHELRIPLDTAFARRFVDYDTTNAYKSDTLFKTIFKGFQVVASEGGSSIKKALAYFNLTDNARTKITFYCRIVNNNKADTIAPVFTYTADAEADLIRRTPAHGYFDNVNNSAENDEKIYIQGAPGSYATLKIPGLANLDNRVIHLAQLIAERVPSFDDNVYAAPGALMIDAINNAGDSAFTIRNDFLLLNQYPGYDLTTLGGILHNDKYIFNLARYVQSIVTHQYRNYTLRIQTPFSYRPYFISPNTDHVSGKVLVALNKPVAFGRVVLYGGASTAPQRMRLRIIYSKI